MIEILSGQKTKKAIVTLAIGGSFEDQWRQNSLPLLLEYCNHHKIGLYLQNSSLDSQKIKKKLQWQKLLLAYEIKANFSFIEEFCYIDTDILVNKNAPSVFDLTKNKLSLVSQFKNLPFDLDMILRRIAFYRNYFLSKTYPLDSSLFMSIKQIYDFHNLTPQLDYACTGLFAGNIEEHSDFLRDIYNRYPASVSTLTEGGDEPIINYEFQSKFEINWLPYEFQALWLYEMAAHYAFLYEDVEKFDLIKKCVEVSLENNVFLHFAGRWHESKMISVASQLSLNNGLRQKFLEYLNTPLTGKPVGRILPTSEK
jgi:hypothetical protein